MIDVACVLFFLGGYLGGTRENQQGTSFGGTRRFLPNHFLWGWSILSLSFLKPIQSTQSFFLKIAEVTISKHSKSFFKKTSQLERTTVTSGCRTFSGRIDESVRLKGKSQRRFLAKVTWMKEAIGGCLWYVFFFFGGFPSCIFLFKKTTNIIILVYF